LNSDAPSTGPPPKDYFRRDQSSGISPPDLSKTCTVAEHIVHARGKRTQYTSVALDPSKIRDLEGDALYRLDRDLAVQDGHALIEHEILLETLRRIVQEGSKEDRLLAAQAHRYAKRRREGLVEWGFDIAKIKRKDLISWAAPKVQAYFTRVRS
jgi:hypothetical protein